MIWSNPDAQHDENRRSKSDSDWTGRLSGSRSDRILPPTLDFGVPDLQGTWSYETRTGLQRPAHYSELEIDKAAMLSTLEPTSEILNDYQNFGTNRQNDPANVGGYDPEYFSIGESLALIDGKYRTSIIIDPPDGRIPYREQGAAIRRRQARAVFQFPDSLGRSDGPEGRPLSDRCLKAFRRAHRSSAASTTTICRSFKALTMLSSWSRWFMTRNREDRPGPS